MNNEKDILEKLTTITQNYMKTYRGNINAEKYSRFKMLMGDDISFDTEWVRESLICHVGHLPIIASYLHPYISHSADVDLGKVLQMLAIHDIGETIVGDVITVARNRTQEESDAEDAAVRMLLNDDQFALHQEYDSLSTPESRFAKSVDKLSGTLMLYCSPQEREKARYEHFGFTLHDLEHRYIPYMEWDSFLHTFYQVLMQNITKEWKSL